MEVTPERLGSFIEYVARPLTEDIRIIFEKAKDLNLPISQELIEHAVLMLGLWHLAGEVIRSVTYLAITWIICETAITIMSSTQSLFQ